MRWLPGLLAVGLLVLGAGWALTRPVPVTAKDIAGIVPDPEAGEALFLAAGCASCHLAEGADLDTIVLAGGHSFDTPVGVFYAPNISTHPEEGIGRWSLADLVGAMRNGTSPDGRHYYPAFPYASYAKADLADLVHIAAYLQTLPADPTPSKDHDLAFPFSIRAGIGLWKALNVTGVWVRDVSGDELERGRYLVEALGHCGECHTPRTVTQGLDRTRWLQGARNPSGKGTIPDITPGGLTWSEADIASYLQSGFTPDFDTVGGSMAAVVRAYARLSEADRAAVAAYLKTVPPSGE